MSLFELFSGKKFQKGMEAGAKPFAAKFEQHAEALKRLERSFGEQWQKTKDVADKILDSVEATERERLYGLYTQNDIKELKPEYKDMLLAILSTLSGENSNEFQQSYIRSVQKYIGRKIPQARIEFAGIENIESLTAQKAILQACMEYLFLGTNNASFFDKYAENLFALFAVKEKAMLEIWENVMQIYFATGPLGLSEKYGFVPIVKPETILSGKQDVFEKYDIKQVLEVSPDQETIIEDKEIILKEDIVCKGKLVLKNCVIYYNGDNIEGQIRLEANSNLVLSHCSIIGKNNTKRREDLSKYIIHGWSSSKLFAENCLFLNCLSFACVEEATLTNCIIRYTEFIKSSDAFLNGLEHIKSQDINFLKASDTHFSKLEECLFESSNGIMDTYSGSAWLQGIRTVINCTFRNVSTCIASSYGGYVEGNVFYSDKTDKFPIITKSLFYNCRNINYRNENYPRLGEANVSDCIFEKCFDALGVSSGGNILNCQFVECGNAIIYARGESIVVDHCDFINIVSLDNENAYKKLWSWGIGFFMTYNKKWEVSSIKNCNFGGINHSGFIRYAVEKGFAVFSNKIMLEISDCAFSKCTAGIIDKQNHQLDYNDVAATINNCTGLENIEGGTVDNFTIRKEAADGQPIGTSLDEADVGVSG